jgi:hypothetical protein
MALDQTAQTTRIALMTDIAPFVEMAQTASMARMA